MFIREMRTICRLEIENELKKKKGENYTAKDVLDFYFSNDSFRTTEYDLFLRRWRKYDKTLTHRLNMLWVIPFTTILAPLTYVLYGHIGWDTRTKLGRFFLKITGNLE